jgi:hypothetical protein
MRQLKLKPRREAIMKELIKVKNTGDVILENKLLNEFRDLTPKRKILKTDENKQ